MTDIHFKPLDQYWSSSNPHIQNHEYVHIPLISDEIDLGYLRVYYNEKTLWVDSSQDWCHSDPEIETEIDVVSVSPHMKTTSKREYSRERGEFKTCSTKPAGIRDPAFPASDDSRDRWSYRVIHQPIPPEHFLPDLCLDIDITYQGHTQRGQVVVPYPLWGSDADIINNHLEIRLDVRGVKHTRTLPIDSLYTVHAGIKDCGLVGNQAMALWKVYFSAPRSDRARNTDHRGIKKLMKNAVIQTALNALMPVERTYIDWLASGKTFDKTTNNRLIAKTLELVLTQKAVLKDVIQKSMIQDMASINVSSYVYSDETRRGPRRALCELLPGAVEAIQTAAEKADWTKRKDVKKRIEGLGVVKREFPKLYAALMDETIPTRVFTSVSGAAINQEFDVWEKALKMDGWKSVLGEIASNAASRKTYSRLVTPYLYFCLYTLPKYLRRQAGGSWKCVPKFVSSTWELEMDETDEGTTKKRSALTPVADMETHTVTVPYAGLHISGRRAQWCYSLNYQVFEAGSIDMVSNQLIPKSLEKGLNGRDDYGLMYYTLTGTVTASGYPTFLIIFERRESGVVVHFHRTHPSRSKDGKATAPKDLIRRCYQYMAGNVAASEIVAQQGDLIFIPLDHDPVAKGAKIGDVFAGDRVVFESHSMERSDPFEDPASRVNLHRSTAKTPRNRLGFLNVPHGCQVTHPEHDDIENLPAGWYEIRRCRSWEANPVEIRVLTID